MRFSIKRFRRYSRRKKILLAATSLLCFGLIVGGSTSAIMIVKNRDSNISDLQNANDDLQQQNQDLQSQVDDLNSQVDDLKNQISDLQDQLNVGSIRSTPAISIPSLIQSCPLPSWTTDTNLLNQELAKQKACSDAWFKKYDPSGN